MPTDVVLLHGVGLDHRMWERVLPLLGGKFRAHTPCLRGHGDASEAAEGTTLADLADDVAERIATIQAPVRLAGFSLGALVATELALQRPELVESLVLVSGVVNRSAAERAAVRGRLSTARTNLGGTYRAAVDRWFSPQWRAAEPDLAGEVLATLEANRPESYLACYSVFASADAVLWPRLGGLRRPVLALTGEHDTGSTPAMQSALVRRVPNGRALIVPGARHLLPLERPDAVAEAILGAGVLA